MSCSEIAIFVDSFRQLRSDSVHLFSPKRKVLLGHVYHIKDF